MGFEVLLLILGLEIVLLAKIIHVAIAWRKLSPKQLMLLAYARNWITERELQKYLELKRKAEELLEE